MSASTQIPPELFKHILRYFRVASGHTGSPWKEYFDLNTKREAGNCALVCRYWAQICQPIIFRSIILGSEKDARDLLTLAASPHSNITRYIRHFDVNLAQARREGTLGYW